MIRNADWLAAEPFTLVLSAGFFGFYAHAGVLAGLDAAGLRPARVVGTSAGAITGGLFAAGLGLASIVELLRALRREDFWDPSVAAVLRGGLLHGRKLDALLGQALTTAGAAERIEACPIALAIVTHDLRARRTCVHERGDLRAAIRASAALPIMFGPVRIDGRLHADGGIRDRPGFRALAPNERALYHHLPHRSRWPRSGSETDDRRPTPNRKVLAFEALPRVHPGAMDRGLAALAHAREGTQRWLAESEL